MKRVVYFLFLVVAFSSCWFVADEPNNLNGKRKNSKLDKAAGEMISTDKAFSEMSVKEGMKKAFLEFAADETVLLRPGYLPIVDDDVIKFINAQEDTSFTMSWETKGADIANSLDMGYTYGVYAVETKDTILRGTYLSIWRKQPDGKWKFVLDTGNSGISETVQ